MNLKAVAGFQPNSSVIQTTHTLCFGASACLVQMPANFVNVSGETLRLALRQAVDGVRMRSKNRMRGAGLAEGDRIGRHDDAASGSETRRRLCFQRPFWDGSDNATE